MGTLNWGNKTLFTWGVDKIKAQQPIDDKMLRAIRDSLIRGGYVNDIQDNADEYIQHGYQGNADVYSIIRRYVTMSTQAKLTLKQKNPNGEIVDIEGHALNEFLTMVNPNQSMSDFREAYTIYLLSIGNSFWYKPMLDSGMNKGKTTQIYSLPANDVEVLSDNHAVLTPEIRYKLENSQTTFEVNEIYHSKYFNPFFYTKPTLYGQSPLQAAADTLTKQNEAEKTQAKQFENQGPAYLLYRDGTDSWNTMSDPQKVELQKEINGLASKGKQGSGIVLKDKFAAIKLGVSASDLNILESTREGRRILCNVYQLPAALFNDPAGSTYNNVIEARKAAWTDALMPHNNKFADDLTQFLINPVEEYKSKGYFYAMDYSSVEELQLGIKEKVEWMIKAHWSANQILEATGKDKVDNPQMDEPIFAQNEVLLNELNLDTNLDNKNYGDYK
jgi:HK97 family phage portal protein